VRPELGRRIEGRGILTIPEREINFQSAESQIAILRNVGLWCETRAGKQEFAACHTEANVQKLSSLLFTTLLSISIIAPHESMAQTSTASSKAGAVSANDNTRPTSRHAGVWVRAKAK